MTRLDGSRGQCPWRQNLSHLAQDQRGNTLMLVAVALIPITAMIGSGIDAGRAYMAKNRLQNACDAAALAGRRAIHSEGGGEGDPAVREAKKFFSFNFPQGSYATEPFELAVTKPDISTVRISAETKMPTSVMRIMGFDTLPLSVTCEASQNLVNTDIVLILDVTSSMNDPAQSGASTKKIEDLQEGVKALYRELKPIQKNLADRNLRLRYGIVPYSSTVNVGKLIYDVNPSYIVDEWVYQSRVAVMSNGTIPTFSHWRHQPRTIDTSQYKKFVPTPTPTEKSGSGHMTTWSGCIEERDTINTITQNSGLNIPAGAFDLDIHLVPNADDGTKWRPLWPRVEYWRNTEAPEEFDDRDADHTEKKSDGWVATNRGACPPRARGLQEWSENDFNAYINGLSVNGNTYHDIGMIWGARLISPRGIFAANNPDTYHNMPVSRHIIYMTDGLIAPSDDFYSSYGFERYDSRVSGVPHPTDLPQRHEQRFRMVCYAAKQMDVSIWVVAFASALTPALEECASNPSQASTSASGEELRKKFAEIGKNIGALRLSK